uniref:Uncharacterized protein n=1 Tax=Pectobacterium versatile TaxID=2488639 RepID=A0A855MMA2_9GAMM|nr:hypothetical protein F131LOC_00109 [Pectobacterium versatile]
MVVTHYWKNISSAASKKGFTTWNCQIHQKNGRDLIPAFSEAICFFQSVLKRQKMMLRHMG